MASNDNTSPQGGPRFANALNQPMPPPQTRNFADAVLGLPPDEAAFLQEVRKAAGDQAELTIQRIEESQKIRDSVLRHLLIASGRAPFAHEDSL